MGWWESLWPSSSSAEDPLRKLDPKLREFLERESPIKYNTQQQQTPSAPPPVPEKASPEQDEENGGSVVPPESAFQDGRYAHLWKTYRPLAAIEAETKTDHERLMDVLEAYKDRRNAIGRAALENCALEQMDWRVCMNSPSVAERMTMCRQQVRKFEKCYMTQTRLLKALGYLSVLDRDPVIEEEIQMHADTLFHRLLSQEAEIEAARAEGRPLPKFPPLIPQVSVGTTTAAVATRPIELTPEQREILKAKLEKVAPEDRAAEEEAYKGELRAKADVADRVKGLWKQQELDRQTRRERGEETMWDKVTGVFGSGSGNDKK